MMKIAIIDYCPMSSDLYSEFINKETGARVDCFRDPLSFVATKVVKYDLIISDYYFKTANLDFYWDYIDPERLIILTADNLDSEVPCLSVLMKSSIHTKQNILSLVKMTLPSLSLVRPLSP